MAKSNPRLAGQKNEPQNVIRTRWIIMSRLRCEHQRKLLGLSDKWQNRIYFDNERKAEEELSWLMSHASMREYMFVEEVDELDDDIPS